MDGLEFLLQASLGAEAPREELPQNPFIVMMENEAFSKQLVHNLHKQRQSGQFCDIAIRLANNYLVHAHACVLAAQSPYFAVSCSSYNHGHKRDGSNMLHLDLTDVKADIFEMLLKYLYTGTLSVTLDQIKDIFQTASRLRIDPVKDLCTDYLKQNISLSNYVNIYTIAQSLNLTSVVKKVVQDVIDHFNELQTLDVFNIFSYGDLVYALKQLNKEKEPGMESKKLSIVFKWLCFRPTDRIPIYTSAIELIDFQLIHREQLVNLLRQGVCQEHGLKEIVSVQNILAFAKFCDDCLSQERSVHIPDMIDGTEEAKQSTSTRESAQQLLESIHGIGFTKAFYTDGDSMSDGESLSDAHTHLLPSIESLDLGSAHQRVSVPQVQGTALRGTTLERCSSLERDQATQKQGHMASGMDYTPCKTPPASVESSVQSLIDLPNMQISNSMSTKDTLQQVQVFTTPAVPVTIQDKQLSLSGIKDALDISHSAQQSFMDQICQNSLQSLQLCHQDTLQLGGSSKRHVDNSSSSGGSSNHNLHDICNMLITRHVASSVHEALLGQNQGNASSCQGTHSSYHGTHSSFQDVPSSLSAGIVSTASDNAAPVPSSALQDTQDTEVREPTISTTSSQQTTKEVSLFLATGLCGSITSHMENTPATECVSSGNTEDPGANSVIPSDKVCDAELAATVKVNTVSANAKADSKHQEKPDKAKDKKQNKPIKSSSDSTSKVTTAKRKSTKAASKNAASKPKVQRKTPQTRDNAKSPATKKKPSTRTSKVNSATREEAKPESETNMEISLLLEAAKTLESIVSVPIQSREQDSDSEFLFDWNTSEDADKTTGDEKTADSGKGPDCKPSRDKAAKTDSATEKEYRCPKCPKTFQKLCILHHHIKGHGNDEPYLCEMCGFSTIHSGSMRVHKKQHTGNKLKCTYPGCKYETVRKGRLVDHLNSHRGVKDYTCRTCKKAFTGKKHLSRHEKIHEYNKKYRCADCSYTSSRQDKYRDHLRKHHQDTALRLGFITEEEIQKSAQARAPKQKVKVKASKSPRGEKKGKKAVAEETSGGVVTQASTQPLVQPINWLLVAPSAVLQPATVTSGIVQAQLQQPPTTVVQSAGGGAAQSQLQSQLQHHQPSTAVQTDTVSGGMVLPQLQQPPVSAVTPSSTAPASTGTSQPQLHQGTTALAPPARDPLTFNGLPTCLPEKQLAPSSSLDAGYNVSADVLSCLASMTSSQTHTDSQVAPSQVPNTWPYNAFEFMRTPVTFSEDDLKL